jgi:O-antigen/teichoic acid export membrane protein
MLLVARILGPSDFGSFALTLAVLYFLNTLQVGFVTRPHNVIGAGKEGEAYRRYTASSAITQIAFTLASAFLVGGAALFASLFHAGAATLLAALVPLVVTWQLQEFARRVLYTEDRLADAFALDLMSYATQTALILALANAGLLTGESALVAMAAAFALALAFGAFQIRSSIGGTLDPSAWRENWRFGRWVAAADAARWTSTEVYLYIAAALLGTAAAGAIRAAQVLVGPLRVVVMFLYGVLPVRFARTLSTAGRERLHHRVRTAYAITIPVLIAFCVPVALLATPLLRVAFGEQYANAGLLLSLAAVHYSLSCLKPIVAALLQAERLTRPLFMAQLYASAIALPFGWILVMRFGAEGAVVGMIVTAIITNAYCWLAYRRHLAAEARVRALEGAA